METRCQSCYISKAAIAYSLMRKKWCSHYLRLCYEKHRTHIVLNLSNWCVKMKIKSVCSISFSITEAEEGGEGTPTDAEERRIDSLNLSTSVTCGKRVTSVNRVYLTKSRLKEKSGHLCTHTYTTYIYYNTYIRTL